MSSIARAARRIGANATRALKRVAAQGLVPSHGAWLVLGVGPDLGELRAPALPFASEPSLSLIELLQTLESARTDSRIAGVVLRFRGRPAGWSRMLALRRAVQTLRAAGKRVVAVAETLDAEQYLVATAADRIWLPESGALFLVGLRTEQLHVRGLLEQLEVQPEIVRIGSFKTAGEMLSRDAMSPEQRQQLEAWQNDLFDALVEGVATGRSLPAERVRALIDEGPYPARRAVEAGLIDACHYADELEPLLDELSPVPPPPASGPRRARLVDGLPYAALHAIDSGWQPLARELPRIAYVVSSGSIRRGRGWRGIAHEVLGGLLEQLREDPSVRAVVLRVDSPGGDALASDLIHRNVDRLRREKPVVVSMGDVAASGGYYVSAAADTVFAEVATLTGSIGVVGGKVNLAGLYRRLGIAKDAVARGRRAGLLSEARSFTSEERAAVRSEMEAVYDTFLARVAEGRALERKALERIAQGRIWSGLRARSLGLVDAIGGPLEALDEARRKAGLAPDERFRLELHPRMRRWSLASLLEA